MIRKLLPFLSLMVFFCFALPNSAHAADPCDNVNTNIVKCLYSNAIADACWLCPAFAAFYEGALSLGYVFSTKIADSVVSLVAVVLGVWLLWQVMKLFMPFGPAGGIGETFNKITAKIALLIFILVFLTAGGTGFRNIWTYFVDPIINTGFGLSASILQSATDIVGSSGDFNGIRMDVDVTDSCPVASRTYADFPILNNPSKFDSASAASTTSSGKTLLCQISSVQNVMGTGLVMGIYVIKIGISNIKVGWDVGEAINSFAAALYSTIVGVFLILVFLIAMILYPLYVADTIFRFAVVVVISPILVASYLFEITRSWATTGIKMLVACAASLMFQALIVGLSLSVIVATNENIKAVLTAKVGAGTTLDNLAFTTPYSIAQLVIFGYGVAGILVLFLMRKANSLAQEFVGVAVGDMGANLAGAMGGKMVGLGAGAALAAASGGLSLAASGASAAFGAMGGGGGGTAAGGAAGAGGGPPPNGGGGGNGGGSPVGGGGIAAGFLPAGGGGGTGGSGSPPSPSAPAGSSGGGSSGGSSASSSNYSGYGSSISMSSGSYDIASTTFNPDGTQTSILGVPNPPPASSASSASAALSPSGSPSGSSSASSPVALTSAPSTPSAPLARGSSFSSGREFGEGAFAAMDRAAGGSAMAGNYRMPGETEQQYQERIARESDAAVFPSSGGKKSTFDPRNN